MTKYVDKKCEMCDTPLLHVPSNRRFCSECGKIRQRELARARSRRINPLWREQSAVVPPEERYKNRLQQLTDDYRYGARHLVNEAVIRQIKIMGKMLGYTKDRIDKDVDKAKQEAQRGIKSYHATPEEIKEMLGGL